MAKYVLKESIIDGIDDDVINLYYDEEDGLYYGYGEIISCKAKTLKELVEKIEVEAEDYDFITYSGVRVDTDEVDWEEKDPEDLGQVRVVWEARDDEDDEDDDEEEEEQEDNHFETNQRRYSNIVKYEDENSKVITVPCKDYFEARSLFLKLTKENPDRKCEQQCLFDNKFFSIDSQHPMRQGNSRDETKSWFYGKNEDLNEAAHDEGLNKEFNYKGIHIIYDEGEEQDIKDLVDEMIENYYSNLKDVKEMNFAFSDEDGNFIIDGELYQYAGGRLYGPYGKVKFFEGSWWKKIEE